MHLHEAAEFRALEIIQDATFESLGIVTGSTPRMLTFVESDRFIGQLRDHTNIACVITTTEIARLLLDAGYGIAVVDNPRRAFYELHNALAQQMSFYWHDAPTEISPDAYIHPRAFVAEKNVRIGSGTVIEAGANILERSILGSQIIVRSGATIGSQGFEFKRVNDTVLSVAHAGGVKIGDRVEIQANSAISRAVFGGYTEIGEDTKLDNLVHIAHNVSIGRRCLIAASAMIAGSVVIGDDVWIGPSASISNGVTIGTGASVTLGSVVMRDVAPGQKVTGNFAVEHQVFLRHLKQMIREMN